MFLSILYFLYVQNSHLTGKSRSSYNEPMRHFILIMYIVLLSSGGAGLVSLILLHNRFRRNLTRNIILVHSGLLLSLFLNIVLYYQETVLQGSIISMQYAFIPAFLLGCVVYFGMALTLGELPGAPKQLLILATGAVVLTMLGKLILAWRGLELLQSLLALPLTLLISLYLFFLGTVSCRYSGAMRETSLSWLFHHLGRFLQLFALGSSLFYILARVIPPLGRLNVSLDYLFSFVWSILASIAFIRYLTRPSALAEGEELPESFLDHFNISKREAEVIAFIRVGKSNKEIADAMFVSFATARTHVYNIFRKVDVKSRVELLNIISGFRE